MLVFSHIKLLNESDTIFQLREFYNICNIFQPIPKTYNPNGHPRICVIDCGLKYNQLRCLLKRGARVDVVPWNYDFKTAEYDGLFLSNGPGDPSMCQVTVENIREVLKQKRPIFGICLGHQLLSIAAGCVTYKMRYVPYINHMCQHCSH